MVTENNVPEVEVPVEPAGAEEVSPVEEPSADTASVEEIQEPQQEQAADSGEAGTVVRAEAPATGDVRTYSQDEFAKLQSANDKAIAETQKQNRMLAEQVAQARQQADDNNLQQQVAVYAEQQRQKWVAQGIDETTAAQIANEHTAVAKEAYLTKMANDRASNQNQQMAQEINARSQQARAYELATQNGINFTDLDGIYDPAAMERTAKALGRVKKLEQRLQGNTGSQTYGTAQPSADVAPTDAESVIDRYNSGDPAISTEQANSAAKKLGMPGLI